MAAKQTFVEKVNGMDWQGKVDTLAGEIKAMHRSVNHIHGLLCSLIVDCKLNTEERNVSPLNNAIKEMKARFKEGSEAKTIKSITRWLDDIGFFIYKDGGIGIDFNQKYDPAWLESVKKGRTWYEKMQDDSFKELGDMPAKAVGDWLAKLQLIGGEVSDDDIIRTVRALQRKGLKANSNKDWAVKHQARVDAGEIEAVAMVEPPVPAAAPVITAIVH